MANKKISQMNTLAVNRGMSSLFNEDLLDISIKKDGEYLSTQVTFAELKSQISVDGIGHGLSSPTHTDTMINGELQHGQALVWTGEKFTNEFASGGSGVDWEYVSVDGHNISDTSITHTDSATDLETIYTLDGFTSSDGQIQSNNIRAVFIELTTNLVSTSVGSCSYNDVYGNPHILLERQAQGSTTGESIITTVLYVPVNNNQLTLDLTLHIDPSCEISYEIVGLQQTKQASLSPDVDFIKITGSVDNTTNKSGIISTDVVLDDTIWSSETPLSTSLTSWGDILPLTIDGNVTKSVITWKQINSNTNGTDEETGMGELTIDWVNGVVMGSFGIGDNANVNSIGYTHGSTSSTTSFDWNTSTNNPECTYGVGNKVITKLPFFKQDTHKFERVIYDITNYKTYSPDITQVSGVKQFNEYVGGRGANALHQHGFLYINNDNQVIGVGNNTNYRFGRTTSCNAPGNILFHNDFNIIGNEPVKCYLTARASFILTKSGNVYACGYNGRGALTPDDGTILGNQQHLIKCTVTNVKKIAVNNQPSTEGSVHFLTNDGELYSSGYNGYGLLGTGDTVQTGVDGAYHNADICDGQFDDVGGTIPSTVVDVLLTGRISTSIVLLSNGVIKTAGSNGRGCLGNGTTTDRSTFDTVVATGMGKITEIQSFGLDNSEYNGVVVRNELNELWGWGENTCHHLTDSASYITTPTQITPSLTPVRKYWVHQEHCKLFVLYENGNLYAGGNNRLGALGLGSNQAPTTANTLTEVDLSNGLNPNNILEIFGVDNYAATAGITFIICTDGIYSSGHNGQMDLGINTYGDTNIFTKMITPLGVTKQLADLYDESGELRPILFTEHVTGAGMVILILDKNGEVYGCGKGWRNILGTSNNGFHLGLLTKQGQYK